MVGGQSEDSPNGRDSPADPFQDADEDRESKQLGGTVAKNANTSRVHQRKFDGQIASLCARIAVGRLPDARLAVRASRGEIESHEPTKVCAGS